MSLKEAEPLPKFLVDKQSGDTYVRVIDVIQFLREEAGTLTFRQEVIGSLIASFSRKALVENKKVIEIK